MVSKSVLLVDDDEDIIEFLEYNFKKEGYTVFTAYNGADAIKTAIEKNPTVIILDIMMPGMDGIQVCQNITGMKDKVDSMIVFLTARGEDYSQIAGFDSGADDFVVKPVNPKVLIKKVDAMINRSSKTENTVKPRINKNRNIRIDKESYIVWYDENAVILPRKEFNLLQFLASKPGKVFQRDEIYDNIWGDVYVGERTIDVHIRKLREKLGEDIIQTIKGVGYKLNV